MAPKCGADSVPENDVAASVAGKRCRGNRWRKKMSRHPSTNVIKAFAHFRKCGNRAASALLFGFAFFVSQFVRIVCHAAVFGSVARGDAIATSDVDVLVELDPAAHVSLYDLTGIELRLSDIFGRKVDVVSRRGLRPRLDDSILADAVNAF
jgi:predicted nucleotidyltransferase